MIQIMKTTLNQKVNYTKIAETQTAILDELRQLRIKMGIVGSLRKFRELTERGRKFARMRGIKPTDVLAHD